jgi:hypothetical protein
MPLVAFSLTPRERTGAVADGPTVQPHLSSIEREFDGGVSWVDDAVHLRISFLPRTMQVMMRVNVAVTEACAIQDNELSGVPPPSGVDFSF